MKLKTRTVILVRHCHYDLNSGRLSDLGKQQAHFLAQAICEVFPAKIYSSSMPRAQETATLINQKLTLNLKVRSYFQELALPGTTGFRNEPKNSTQAALKLKRKKAFQELEKAFKFILKPARQNEVIVVVSHENLIRHLICKALGTISSKRWHHLSIGHASITTMKINEKGTAVVTGLSEQMYLPIEMRTRTSF